MASDWRGDPALVAWLVGGEPPRAGGSREEQLRLALRYAILAPSGHNTQPWLFRLTGDGVEILADRSRGLPVVDPDDRALTISCGAALELLVIALAGLGWECEVVSLPDAAAEDLLARVRPSARAEPDAESLRLFTAIPARRTNRLAFEDRPLPADLGSELAAAARATGSSLMVVTERGAKERLADLIAEGDRRQMSGKAFRRELVSWMHPNRSRSRDGIRGYSLGFGEVMSLAGPLVVRTFDLGAGQAAKDRDLATGAPALAVLGTAEDSTAAWLGAGRALAQVLLRATAAGVSTSFLNQPIEVAALRPAVEEAVSVAAPQILLRLGYGPEVRPSPRRPLDEVLLPPTAG